MTLVLENKTLVLENKTLVLENMHQIKFGILQPLLTERELGAMITQVGLNSTRQQVANLLVSFNTSHRAGGKDGALRQVLCACDGHFPLLYFSTCHKCFRKA
jgi:hypothetical protein